MRSVAMLDAIVEPDWEGRYYSFDAHWGAGEQLAQVRDGQGDWLAVLFVGDGAVMCGCCVRQPRPPASKLFRGLPKRYRWARAPDGFVAEEVNFCQWYDHGWKRGAETRSELSELICLNPDAYEKWGREYYEREFDREGLKAVFAQVPLTTALIQTLNPATTLNAARRAAKEIAYPMAKTKTKTKAKAKTKTKAKAKAKPRKLSPARAAAVARMKAARGIGSAAFTVRVDKDRVTMLVHDKPVVEVETSDEKLYPKIFDLVQAMLTEAKN